MIFVRILLTIAQLAAFVRLIWLGRRYRWFAGYVGVDLLRSAVLFFLTGGRSPASWHSYYLTWICTEPVALILLVGTAFELVGRLPEHYRGFGDFGRKRLQRWLQIAIAIALVSSTIEASSYDWNFSVTTWLPFLITAQRMVTSALAGYLVLTAIWLWHVRIPMQPNLLRHSVLFASYLLFDTAVMLFYMLYANGHGAPPADMVLTIGSTLLFMLWAAFLTSDGEAFPRHPFLSPEESEELQRRETELISLMHSTRRHFDEQD